MSEGQSTYENKVNPDTINAEYLRSIGPDKQKVAQAEFNRIAPSLEAVARSWSDSQFKVTIPRFVYAPFVNILKERGFFNICSREVNLSGRAIEVCFQW